MALPKQKFREIVFQILYSMDFTQEMDEAVLDFVMVKLKVGRKSVREASEKVRLIKEHLEELDAKITFHSKDYSLDRIARIEKNILRLGFYEILYDQVPGKVAISEAIRLCKKFAAPENTKFINAVLDAEYQQFHSEK